MDFLLNPNIAYVLIVASVLLALVTIIIPGTGVPEVLLVFCLMLAGYQIYHLGINAWAVIILVLSLLPFFLAIRSKKWRLPLLAGTILLLIGGSLFLFTNTQGWPAVDPVLAAIVSLVSGGFVWIGVERSLVAMQKRPIQDPDALVGQEGEAKTEIHAKGSVQVDGELWSARSETLIKAGSMIRVIQRDGFVLVVEKTSE